MPGATLPVECDTSLPEVWDCSDGDDVEDSNDKNHQNPGSSPAQEDRQTHRQTDTQTKYSNPHCACAPRVNEHIYIYMCMHEQFRLSKMKHIKVELLLKCTLGKCGKLHIKYITDTA